MGHGTVPAREINRLVELESQRASSRQRKFYQSFLQPIGRADTFPSVSKESQLKAFGARVKALRKQQGLTQEALAERSGLSARYVSRVELGNVNLGLTAILQIAEGLETHPGELFETLQ